MKDKNNNLNAVNMVRKIRDNNYQITKNMSTAEKLEYIHKRATVVNEKLGVAAKKKCLEKV
jgi:hypothetical protein